MALGLRKPCSLKRTSAHEMQVPPSATKRLHRARSGVGRGHFGCARHKPNGYVSGTPTGSSEGSGAMADDWSNQTYSSNWYGNEAWK
jgi:hypothetical protein